MSTILRDEGFLSSNITKETTTTLGLFVVFLTPRCGHAHHLLEDLKAGAVR